MQIQNWKLDRWAAKQPPKACTASPWVNKAALTQHGYNTSGVKLSASYGWIYMLTCAVITCNMLGPNAPSLPDCEKLGIVTPELLVAPWLLNAARTCREGGGEAGCWVWLLLSHCWRLLRGVGGLLGLSGPCRRAQGMAPEMTDIIWHSE